MNIIIGGRIRKACNTVLTRDLIPRSSSGLYCIVRCVAYAKVRVHYLVALMVLDDNVYFTPKILVQSPAKPK